MKMNIFMMITTEIMQINSLLVKDSFNILMKDSAVYSIDESLSSDDYEMIVNNNETDKKNQVKMMLYDLNKLAEEEYEKTFKTTYAEELDGGTVLKENDKYNITPFVQYISKHFIHKRDSMSGEDQEYYDYDDLLSDYLELDNNDTVVGHEPENIPNDFKGIIYLIIDYITKGHSQKIILMRLWRISRIWFLVYLIIAVPLCCTKGWCCCCLFCKFFKPQRTIDEAKRYFLLNPPGLITVSSVGVICYEATEREKESYEKFGHMIRTI